MTSRFLSSIALALEDGQPFALGIIAGTKGSSPQRSGAKALFFADGRIVGTLGGGCLEAEVRERARQALRSGEPAVFDLVLDHDFGWDDGLICGGRVSGLILPNAANFAGLWRELAGSGRPAAWGVRRDFTIARVDEAAGDDWLYRETATPSCALWIAGAGHVAQAVAPLAQQLEFEVTVFDDRAELANRWHFTDGIALRVDDWEVLLREPLPEQTVFGLIVTRGHQHDARVLRAWVRRPFAFLGMIGSRRKRRIIFTQFREDGLATEAELDRVECPVGLDIGAVTVPEIAVSVVGRLIERRAALRRVVPVARDDA